MALIWRHCNDDQLKVYNIANNITHDPFQDSFRGQTLDRGIATPDNTDKDKVINKQVVGSLGRLSWDGLGLRFGGNPDPSAESFTSLISDEEERRSTRKRRLLLVLVLILILLAAACVAVYLGLTLGKGSDEG